MSTSRLKSRKSKVRSTRRRKEGITQGREELAQKRRKLKISRTLKPLKIKNISILEGVDKVSAFCNYSRNR